MEFEPTVSQLKAITYPSGPLLIIAGAGTGKTSTLILRMEHMIKKGLWRQGNIVLLTFTDRATEEVSARVRDHLTNSAEEITISTFHRFCNRLVREYSKSPDAEKLLLQEDDITFLLLSRFDELKFLKSHDFRTDPVNAVVKSFVPFFNRIRDELISPEELEQKFREADVSQEFMTTQFPGMSEKVDPEEYLRQFNDLVRVYDSYQSWKKELGVVDYGDMILDCWEMLNTDASILRLVREQFRHIVIDEYQDNNYGLNRIATLIAGDRPSITVVGDEDQCIYSFRGANYYNIRDFRQKYGVKKNRGETTLEDNHRSTEEILDAANASIAHDTNRTPKILKSATRRHGPKPVWHVGERLQVLAGIPRLVRRVVNDGRHFGDIAVLCRSWNHVKEVAQAVQMASIPVDVFVERFFSVPEVRSLLAWGHLVCGDVKADISLFHLLTRYGGRPFAEKFFHDYDTPAGDSLIADLNASVLGMDLTRQEKETLQWFIGCIDKLRHELKQNRRADEMVWEILKITDMLKPTRHNYRYRHRLALANVGHIMTLAESFSLREESKTLDRWLEYMSVLVLDGSRPAVQPEFHDSSIAVQVMTVHKSKGLQFPVVIIPFLRSGSFPVNYRPSSVIDRLPEEWYHWRKPEDTTPKDDHLNEERRIFYVAITRAMDEVHFYGPDKARSVLLEEIQSRSEEYVERKDMTKQASSGKRDTQSKLKQKLLVELNRELSARQYENAHLVIDGLQTVEETGELPRDHPYARLMDGISEDDREIIEKAEDIIHLSASSVEEYDRCPYKYRLGRIDRVPERKSRVQMEFGTIIHNVLQEFHSIQKDLTEDQNLQTLLSLLEKHWRSEAFEYLMREEEFKRQGKQMLGNYLEFFKTDRPNVVAREARFDFRIDEIHTQVSGKIDRIDSDEDGLIVTDYKTGKMREKARSNLQLALYTEALRRNAVEGVEGTPVLVRLHFLRYPDDPIESHVFEPGDLTKHLDKVKEAANGIRKRKFNPIVGRHCNYCDYRDFLCPAWENR